MTRTTLGLATVACFLALAGGPAAPAAATHARSSPGAARPARASQGVAPAQVTPRPQTGNTTTTRYLVLVPDFNGFYYSPWAADFYWGWPCYYSASPYGAWAGPISPPLAREGYVEVGSAGNETALELHVSPRSAEVKLDGKELGKAKDYDRWSDRLPLRPGNHLVEMAAPDHRTLRVDLKAEKDQYYVLHYRLKRGEGSDPRSAKDPAAMASPRPDSSGRRASASGPATSGSDSTQEPAARRLERRRFRVG
jgi:hypothetical protein